MLEYLAYLTAHERVRQQFDTPPILDAPAVRRRPVAEWKRAVAALLRGTADRIGAVNRHSASSRTALSTSMGVLPPVGIVCYRSGATCRTRS
jgi:hypothetical protein